MLSWTSTSGSRRLEIAYKNNTKLIQAFLVEIGKGKSQTKDGFKFNECKWCKKQETWREENEKSSSGSRICANVKLSSTRRINGSVGKRTEKTTPGKSSLIFAFDRCFFPGKNLGDIRLKYMVHRLQKRFHFMHGINNCPSIIGTFMFYAFIIVSPPSHCLSPIDHRQSLLYFLFFTYFFPFGNLNSCAYFKRTSMCPNFSSYCECSYFHLKMF